MKIAFVAGFFDPVKKALEESYSEHLTSGSVIWIRQQESGTHPPPTAANLKDFSSRFFDVIRRVDSILIILAVPTQQRWVEDRVRAMIDKATQSAPNVTCNLVTCRNAGDRAEVITALDTYDLKTDTGTGVDKIRAKIPTGKILCVSHASKTSILLALERAGFSARAIEECFEEERIDGARNSNLVESLGSRANSYPFLLYAWDGLRTIDAKTKRNFAGCYEAPSAAKVVQFFKALILGVG
jgi:hypothetical protein